jgi:hypothetical protein
MDLKSFLNQLNIKSINLILTDFEKENYYETEVVISLTKEQLIKILEDEELQEILKKKLNIIEINLEYPRKISSEIKEIINNNKVGEIKKEIIEFEYWENKKKRKKKIKVEYLVNKVESYIDNENFGIVLHSFSKENLIKCIENLLNILKKGGEVM